MQVFGYYMLWLFGRGRVVSIVTIGYVILIFGIKLKHLIENLKKINRDRLILLVLNKIAVFNF